MQDTTMNSWQEKCKSFLHKKLSSRYFLKQSARLNKNAVNKVEAIYDVERVLLDLNFPLDTPSRREYIVFFIL